MISVIITANNNLIIIFRRGLKSNVANAKSAEQEYRWFTLLG